MIQPLIIAFQLLTRIPISSAAEHTPRNQGHSLLYYPLVGAVLGGALVLLGSQLSDHPTVLQAALLLILWVGFTGGLHLDGLADSADAWVGGMGSRSRMLEIMKDPASGPMGVIAIVLLLLLKWSAIVALLEEGQLWLLFWAPLLARTATITLMQRTPYLRAGGMGAVVAENIPHWRAIALQVAVLAAALSLGVGWELLLLYLLVLLLFRRVVVRQLGGLTGDVIGASIEVMEALFILLCVLL